MTDPFVGEIRLFAGNFAPLNWAFCNGQLVAISENTALYQLLGTTYGGDGVETFALPNLQGRLPYHQGPGFVIGQVAGTETVTLTSQQLPSHNHLAQANTAAGTSDTPSNQVWATASVNLFATPGSGVSADTTLDAATIAPNSGSQPHDNLPPFVCVSFIISLAGLFPQQN